jgi:hypothetical protein
LLDLLSQGGDLLTGHVSVALLYAYLAGLKAAQQLAQAGQYIDNPVGRGRRNHSPSLG